jgi:ankyrin repeat protein
MINRNVCLIASVSVLSLILTACGGEADTAAASASSTAAGASSAAASSAAPAVAAPGSTVAAAPVAAKVTTPSIDMSKVTDKNINLYLGKAAGAGDLPSVKALLEKGASVNPKGKYDPSPLTPAAMGGHLEVFRFLVEKGAKVTTQLYPAASNGHSDLVDYILPKVDVKDPGAQAGMAYVEAMLNGHSALAAKIKSAGVVFSLTPETYKEFFRVLLTPGESAPAIRRIKGYFIMGVDVNNTENGYKHTPLYYVSERRGQPEFIEFLIKEGAKVNMPSGKYGYTPLMGAAKDGKLDNVKLLVEKGAQLELRDSDADYGRTALHHAASSRKLDVVEFLLSKGADINAKDNKGNTALHLALASGGKDVALFLVSKGASISVKNNEGKAPVDDSHKDIVALIKAAAGK